MSDSPLSVTRLHWPMFNAVKPWHVRTSFASPSSVMAHDPSSNVRSLQKATIQRSIITAYSKMFTAKQTIPQIWLSVITM